MCRSCLAGRPDHSNKRSTQPAFHLQQTGQIYLEGSCRRHKFLGFDGVFPITMPNNFTYHPQNEALLQWFEFQSPSTAINGAYSYPDITTLTALSAPQKAGCAP